MEPLRNKLWVFGHPANALKNIFGITRDSDVEAIASMADFCAENLFFIPMSRPCDRDEKSREMQNIKNTGWSTDNRTEIAELIELKAKYPNIKIALFDDFFSESNPNGNYTNYAIDELKEIKKRLNDAGLEMWAVFYSMQTELDAISDYLGIFDGVSFWFWDEPMRAEFDEKCEFFFEYTKGQKRMMGCFLYNLGKEREADPEMVRYQLDRNLQFVKEGKLDGIIMHSNLFGGMDFAAYDEGVTWCLKHCEDLV